MIYASVHSQVSVIIRYTALLIASLAVTACGGGSSDSSSSASTSSTSSTTSSSSGSHTLGGNVIGLINGQAVQVLNGSDTVSITDNGTFTFSTVLTSGTTYDVTVGTSQPTGQTCAVQNATGTMSSADITNVLVYCTNNTGTQVTSVTQATLTGAYTGVANDVSQKADALNSVSFDGNGGYTGSDTENVNTVISTSSFSGSYTVTQSSNIPVLTANGTDVGAVEFNANAVALLSNAAGGSPGLSILVKPAQNASISTVNGTYTSVAMESTDPVNVSMKPGTLSNGNFNFAGTTGQRNANGTITTGTEGGSGPYTVTSAGAITFETDGSGISGAVSADGDLLVLAPITSTGNGDSPAIYVLVKQGAGVTAATLNGIYSMTGLSTSTTAGTIGRAYTLAIANGALSGTYVENNSGSSSTDHFISGTYTTATDGTLTLVMADGATLTGTVSADGNVFVLADFTSGHAPTLLVGLRQ